MALAINDLLAALDECTYPSGLCKTTSSHAGSYLQAPSGKVSWYFANVGLAAFAAEETTKIKAYLDAYIRNCHPQHWTVQDFDPYTCNYLNSDSDDSYAATFLSLVAAWMKVSRSTEWLCSNLKTLIYIGNKNLLASQKSNGLILSFQASTTAPDGYQKMAQFEDNCEVYGGLDDFTNLLIEYGYSNEAKPFQKALAKLPPGLGTMRTRTTQGEAIYASYQGEVNQIEVNTQPGTLFYPDCVTQIFPQAFRVSALQQNWDSGYKFLNCHAAAWASQDNDNSAGGYPWAIVGYVAALRGDWINANKQLSRVEAMLKDRALRPFVTINELGWCKHIVDLAATAPAPAPPLRRHQGRG